MEKTTIKQSKIKQVNKKFYDKVYKYYFENTNTIAKQKKVKRYEILFFVAYIVLTLLSMLFVWLYNPIIDLNSGVIWFNPDASAVQIVSITFGVSLFAIGSAIFLYIWIIMWVSKKESVEAYRKTASFQKEQAKALKKNLEKISLNKLKEYKKLGYISNDLYLTMKSKIKQRSSNEKAAKK